MRGAFFLTGRGLTVNIIETAREMQEYSESLRLQGKRIAFVPTMGYFHEGHLDLMRIGRKRGDVLVVSIYVNPTQFGPAEDFEQYPRDFERDRKMAESVGVDVIYAPSHKEMYPEGNSTYVLVGGVTENLCGLSRPNFFRGVATVCTKLFNIVKPHVTVFGRKDFQQLVTIRRMVEDLNLDIEVVGMPTTREEDGLAMSSRNVYLKPEERKSALSLSRSLLLAESLYGAGERDAQKIEGDVRRFIEGYPFTKIDYARICDVATMKNVERIERESVLALAVWVGKTRLIDNHVLGEEIPIPAGLKNLSNKNRKGESCREPC